MCKNLLSNVRSVQTVSFVNRTLFSCQLGRTNRSCIERAFMDVQVMYGEGSHGHADQV